jgi:hypothetical protein
MGRAESHGAEGANGAARIEKERKVKRPRVVACFVLLGLLVAGPVLASDATVFIGSTLTPTNRSARGFSICLGRDILAFEFEYSSTSQNQVLGAPSFRTGSVNALLQTPFTIHGIRLYATAGVGMFREALDTQRETNLGLNLGGGVKVEIYGPIGLRVDYRVFKLNGGATFPHPQRVYAGLNLRF